MAPHSRLARLGFGLARTGVLDPVVRLAFARGAPLLPVRRVLLEPAVIAFVHPHPSWPTHVLLVPRRAIASYRDVGRDNAAMVCELFRTAPRVARMLRLGPAAYSLLLNGGARQDVGQLHVHLVAPALAVSAGATPCPVAAAGLAREAELLSVWAWLRGLVDARRLERAGFSLLAPAGLDGPLYLVTD
jgi:histidine triad (HIT) family protein